MRTSMIKLQNIGKNISLDLSVEGYQFPNDKNDDWCLIQLIVKQGNDIFRKVDPALEAVEIASLLEWFKCLSMRRLPTYNCLTFTEPCLEFEFLSCKNETVRISINLKYELKPDFSIFQFGRANSKWCIIFEITMQDFDEIIIALESTLESYPIRGDD